MPLDSGSRLLSGEGLQGPDSSGETLRIHRENQAKLQAMSKSEILEEQKKLMSQLGENKNYLKIEIFLRPVRFEN